MTRSGGHRSVNLRKILRTSEVRFITGWLWILEKSWNTSIHSNVSIQRKTTSLLGGIRVASQKLIKGNQKFQQLVKLVACQTPLRKVNQKT